MKANCYKVNRLFISLLLFIIINSAYSQNQVISTVSDMNQSANWGYQYSRELGKLIAPHVLSGKIKLWLDPNQQKLVDQRTLQALYKTYNTDIALTNQLLLYEWWNVTGKSFYIKPEGFTLIYNNDLREPVVFGYVTFADIDSILRANVIETDANGIANISFSAALANRQFDAVVVNFEGRKIKNEFTRRRIIKAFFERNKFFPSEPLPQSKKNVFVALNNNSAAGKTACYSFSAYLNDNKEELLNLTNGKIASHLRKNQSIKVEEILIQETWTKTQDSILNAFEGLELSINGIKYFYLPKSSLANWDLKIQDMFFEEWYTFNKSLLEIERINHQNISTGMSEKYLRALKTEKWDEINQCLNY